MDQMQAEFTLCNKNVTVHNIDPHNTHNTDHSTSFVEAELACPMGRVPNQDSSIHPLHWNYEFAKLHHHNYFHKLYCYIFTSLSLP